jgi:hypothetical protein
VPVAVEPAEIGGVEGVVELALEEEVPLPALAGSLALGLPALDWTIHRLTWELDLPEVFEYATSGGTLKPAEDMPPVAFADELPASGRKLAFRQDLVAGTRPRLTLDYSIDLVGRYHCASDDLRARVLRPPDRFGRR